MDGRYHEYRLDNHNADESSKESPPSNEDVANFMVRSIAVAEEARDGPGKLGKLIAWDVVIEPLINVDVPALHVHVAYVAVLTTT